MEPAEALARLLQGTGYEAQPNGTGSFVVTPVVTPTGTIRGSLLLAGGAGARGVHVVIPALQSSRDRPKRRL